MKNKLSVVIFNGTIERIESNYINTSELEPEKFNLFSSLLKLGV